MQATANPQQLRKAKSDHIRTLWIHLVQPPPDASASGLRRQA